MSGHSKWSTIKHKKGNQDARRGSFFTKLIKEITVATRVGGGDVTSNPRLRSAIAMAKAGNMPKENIQRAVKRGLGDLNNINYEKNFYEGYGPDGIAVIVESLTDNKNRTVAEIRYIFNKYGGSLGESGCVGWMFDKKGCIYIDKLKFDEDVVMEAVLESGADDMRDLDDFFEIITNLSNFEHIKEAMGSLSISYTFAEVKMVPKNINIVNERYFAKIYEMINSLNNCDDVHKVYTNTNIL